MHVLAAAVAAQRVRGSVLMPSARSCARSISPGRTQSHAPASQNPGALRHYVVEGAARAAAALAPAVGAGHGMQAGLAGQSAGRVWQGWQRAAGDSRRQAPPRSPPAVLRVVLPLAVPTQAARLGADGDALALAHAADLRRKGAGVSSAGGGTNRAGGSGGGGGGTGEGRPEPSAGMSQLGLAARMLGGRTQASLVLLGPGPAPCARSMAGGVSPPVHRQGM